MECPVVDIHAELDSVINRFGVERQSVNDDSLDVLVRVVRGQIRDARIKGRGQSDFHKSPVSFLVIIDIVIVIINAACVERGAGIPGIQTDIPITVLERDGKDSALCYMARVVYIIIIHESDLGDNGETLLFHAGGQQDEGNGS